MAKYGMRLQQMLGQRKWKQAMWLVAIICMIFVAVAPIAQADVGNSVDYNQDYNTSSGGDYNYDSDNGIDMFMVAWLINLLFDNPILLIIVLGLLLFVGIAYKKNGGHIETSSTRGAPLNHQETMSLTKDQGSLDLLMTKDPGFSEQMMISKVNNMFVRLQLAWMNKVWEEVRPFETDALFNTHKMQLDQHIAMKRTNRMEDIGVLNTEILRYYQRGEYDYLDVAIKAKFLDYVVDDTTGKVIKGNPNRTLYMQYKWKLTRKAGVATNTIHVEATACPNCGANISINQAGKCEYCGSIVTKGDFDWVLTEIEVISQR